MKKFFKIAGIIVFIIVVAFVGIYAFVSTSFPRVDPAPTLTINHNDLLLKRGAYLANHVTVCTDCHSTRDWNKFAGPIIPGTEGKGGEIFNEKMGLPGNFYAKNITPHALSDWTDGEIYRLITTGVTKDNEPIFPLMPYQSYAFMDTEDVKAVIAYIRTLPAFENEVPPSEAQFPLNLILRTLPKNAAPVTLPKNMTQIEKGKYLLTIAGCVKCHTQEDQGVPVEGMFLAGGFPFGMPKGGVARSANITPDPETGIGKWSSEAFVRRFKAYVDPTYVNPEVAENSFNTPMPWLRYAHMEVEDLEAIYAYLQTVAPVSNKVVRFTSDAKQDQIAKN